MVDTVRRLLLAAALMALASGGCATGRAKTPVAPTPLDVPAPPPRIIVPPDPEAPPPPTTTEAAPKPQAAPPRQAPPRTEPKTEAPKPADPATVAAAAPVPTATLQQAPSWTVSEARQKIREQLDRIKKVLERVNPALNPDAKSQFETANRFVAQAEQALNEGNLVFAAKVADKAASLAASLPVR
jgi:hypothetical protein